MVSLVKGLCAAVCLHVLALCGIIGFELYQLSSPHFKYVIAAPDPSGATMRAAQFKEFGEASVIRAAQIVRPSCCEQNQVLVKVLAGALNPIDFKQRRNPAPSAMVPLPAITGKDFSGTIEAVGSGVSGFAKGDAVYGMLPLLGQPWGALQEYITVDASIIAKAPSSVPLSEVSGLPLVGLTVLHALAPVLEHWKANGETTTGKRILVHAGSGGVGSFALQYCKNVLGMHVTTTTSQRNTDFVKSLGADEVVDYRSVKFEDVVKAQDVVLDPVTQEYEARALASPTVLKQEGKGHYCHIISTDWQPNGREENPFYVMLPLVKKWVYTGLAKLGSGINYHCDPVTPDGAGLGQIAGWVDQGLVKPVVDRAFPLEKADEAHAFLEAGRARGKVLVEVAASE